jgi:uncharacterized membrane protein HdeD (DUF308 family)
MLALVVATTVLGVCLCTVGIFILSDFFKERHIAPKPVE